MINRYFIVDDFYEDPERLVSAALDGQRDAASRGNYAGVMTQQSFLSGAQRDFFEKLLQQKPINASTELIGKIRFSLQDDPFTQHIHFDAGNTLWSGVVYLSKKHPKTDGTVFWKHLRTGLEEIPRTLEGGMPLALRQRRKLKNFSRSMALTSRCEKNLSSPLQVQSPCPISPLAISFSRAEFRRHSRE